MKVPKALLKIGDHSFVEEIAQKCRVTGIETILVIGGAHYSEIKSKTPALQVIENAEFRNGQISSLQVGLKNLPEEASQVLVWPVDHPLVQAETVRSIIETFHAERNPITIPVFDGKRGHPVYYDQPAVQAALNLREPQTAKELQRMFHDRISLVEVKDSAILIDIDFPEDYRKFVKNGS